jgi:myo-inositol-1(or 4)-monophosphatase
VGAVYQPVLDEMFTAIAGGGAHLNGEPIHVSSEPELERCLLVTGFPYDMHETERDNLDNFRRFAKRARAVRRLGSAALDLCYVACGRFDGFWELKLAPWDLAAGGLIAREAGATLSNLAGGPYGPFEGTVIASNGRIHAAMVSVLGSDR